MPIASPTPIRDPLRVFVEKRCTTPEQRPIPLVSMDFAVVIEGGLAIVTTTRVFRNVEENPIEATLTFPMPVHATLFDLRVKVGERELVGKAQARDSAREIYEDAIDRGKSAVLHEEVLRGIHMLSVANIPAGEAIEVRNQWVTTLTVVSSTGHLRIPVTVGDVYGRSPLAESDDIKTGGEPLSGTLEVCAANARVSLINGTLKDGKTTLALNRPIDLEVEGWRPGAVHGIDAEGRAISLTLQPASNRDSPLNIAILVDHSGSMNERVSSGSNSLSKHDHVVAALGRLAGTLMSDDTIDLWEFDDNVRRVGSGRLSRLVDHLSAPSGGTEIGRALATSINSSTADGILLITDGKSHALDVQGLARMGRRISVILVGEDSLEANVGHLAALTGGDIFVSGGVDVGDVLDSALGSLRGSEASSEKAFRQSGMMVKVSHGSSCATAERTVQERAVAAAAVSFLLPTLAQEEATMLAEREGIVSHLTSLVLVDEAGATHESLPAQRPVALPRPATADMGVAFHCAIGAPAAQFLRRSAMLFDDSAMSFPDRGRSPAIGLGRQIDWASHPTRLVAGDLSQLPRDLRKLVLAIARKGGIQQAASMLGMSPLLLVIALLAHQAGRTGDRAAARIAHRLLGHSDEKQIQKFVLLLEE